MTPEWEHALTVTFTNYGTFFAIATRATAQIKRLVQERGSLPCKTDEDIDRVCKINAEIQRHAMGTVTFSAMALESYINLYGAENLGSAYFGKYLDKLDLRSKWVIVPRMVTGKELDTTSQGFSLFSNLVALRNRLVHDKPRKRRVDEVRDSDWVTEENAAAAIQAVRGMLDALRSLDPRVNIEWLHTAPTDPYA
jgi:hypothetical protein